MGKRRKKTVSLENGIFTVRETAEYLRMSPSSLYNLIQNGEIGGVFQPSPRSTLITASGINAFIKNRVNY